MDVLDPRSYHDDPARYPLGGNDLDFLAAFEPLNDRGMTPIEDRWLEILVFMEAIVRATKRRLDADRQQFAAAEDAALADVPYTGHPGQRP